jgi:ketosteroid isomerase-like protein
MRIFVLLGAGLAIAPAATAETIRAEICRKGADVRRIEVHAPGDIGLACDVVYSREEGANKSIPYNANVDKDYCRARAAELAANLTAEGFDCASEAAVSVEAALAGGERAQPEPGPSPPGLDAPLNRQLDQIAGGQDRQAETPVTEETAAPPTLVARNAAPNIDDLITENLSVEVESSPAPTQRPQPAEPVQLAADAQPSAYKAPRPPKASGPGRLVGAQPPVEKPAEPRVSNAADAGSALPARTAADVIRGVITANAAAWNEGNLDAFMNGYVNSADLLFVRNGVVTTGWREVRKSYEAEIAANAGMGRLSFADLDVVLNSVDRATVVGRYALTLDEPRAEGVMTLVMKQVDGRWRILQDTRVEKEPITP